MDQQQQGTAEPNHECAFVFHHRLVDISTSHHDHGCNRPPNRITDPLIHEMTTMMSQSSESAVIEIQDDGDSLDGNQLAEYQEMVEELGSFPVRLSVSP